LDEITPGGVDMWQRHARQGGSGGEATGGFDKLATRRKRMSSFFHAAHLLPRAVGKSMAEKWKLGRETVVPDRFS